MRTEESKFSPGTGSLHAMRKPVPEELQEGINAPAAL